MIKETLSNAFKKEKERAVGYTEIWSVVQRLEVDVREFIKKLKEEFDIIFQIEYQNDYQKQFIKEFKEKIDNLAGDTLSGTSELTNHSPQENLRAKVENPTEDKSLCECGSYVEILIKGKFKCLNCGKFKPLKKGLKVIE